MIPLLAGIDYGSKRAGTTAIAALRNKQVHLLLCPKKKDADRFILRWTTAHHPDVLYLDAPLSLPGVYRGLPGCTDYFYRQADREVNAMSPMFLGGLTARAMKLKAALQPLPVHEVYPGGLARQLNLPGQGYKKTGDPDKLARQLAETFGFRLAAPPEKWNWHLFDALLGLCIGLRHQRGRANRFGRPDEGQILL